MDSRIETMERLTGFCSHECVEFSHLWWEQGEIGMNMLSCALCDLLMCALPDYIQLISKEEYNGLISN